MNFKNIFKISALSMALVAVTGCTKEVDYDPASQMTNDQVFFAIDAVSSVDLQDNQDSFTVYVSRVNKSGTLTVDLDSYAMAGKEETNIFTVPSSVTFEDGADKAPINVTFDFNDIAPETTYTVTLDLVGESLTPYGKSEQEVSVIYAPWSEWVEMDGYASYTNGSPFAFTDDQLVIKERASLLNPNMVQYSVEEVFAYEYNIDIDVDLSTNSVRVPLQQTGYLNGGAMIYICDSYTFLTEVASISGANPDDYASRSYFNPETGLITINAVLWYPKDGGTLGYWGMDNYDYVQLPGYPDYNVLMSNQGTYISEAGQEYTIIKTEKGNDVASYAITLKQGYLDATEIQAVVDAIIADTETTLYNESQEFQFPVYEEDYYTCITVNYDSAGEPQNFSVYQFYNEIMGVDWNAGWTTVTKNAEFYDVFFAGYMWAQPYSWEVEVQQSDSYPGYYRIVKPYGSNPYGEAVERGHYYVYVDATNPNSVVVYPSFISYIDYPYYVASDISKPGKVVDGTKIVFPAASLGLVTALSSSSWQIAAFWDQESILLDLDPQTESAQSAASNRTSKAKKAMSATNGNKPLRNAAMPYSGKKLEKKEKVANRKF